MTGFHAGGRRIDLGLSEHIADPTTRATYERLGQISAERQQLEHESILLDDQLRDALNAKPEGVAEALWAGEPVDAEMDADVSHIEELRAESARLRKRITAQHEAERLGVLKLNGALDAGATQIAKANLSKLKALPAKLAMIERVLGEVVDTHDTTAGLIHLLEERQTQGGALTLVHGVQTPRVELTLAAEHVRQGLVKLRAEIEAATASLKPSDSEKPRKPRKSVSEAQEAAPATSVTDTTDVQSPEPAAPAVEIAIGGDDDD